ncbi:C40 family peptidase [Sphaerisporangium viridialbum]|uniref:C40 family peptidase n=1 Tax=Sphaerisporangium viridialbum TaxID=46189 RepID=UPI003C749D4C
MTASAGAVAMQATAADAATVTTAQSSSKLSKVAKQRIKAHTAVSVAKKQVGDPYRWGASGPGAFDCSGLVMYAWRKAGVKLPRIAASQFRSVKKKISWKNLKPGDLMFFSGLGHVGMYVGHGKMIHSPHSGARVRIDKLSGYRKAAFVGAVRPGV